MAQTPTLSESSPTKARLRAIAGNQPPVQSANARAEFAPDPPPASNAVAAHAVMVARCGSSEE
jgi:hypothetical protein